MSKSILYILLIAFLPAILGAQDICTAYLPGEGTTLTYASYDKKGKLSSTTTTSVRAVDKKGDTTLYHIHQFITTGKKKNDMENDFVYKCAGNQFFIDMRSILNPEQMEGFKNEPITVTTNNLVIPGNLKPGMELPDGEINMEVHIQYAPINISSRMFYREVESKEEITTPAGTYTAFKIKGYVESKFAFMRVAYKTIEWYVPDLGVVRSESYDNKENLLGYSELEKVAKP
jgi:hypothetical protein